MTKSEIIREVVKKEKLKRQIAEEVVNIIFDSMKDSLVNGEKVEIRGFGSFKIKNYDGYEGRNPRTGEIINVPAKKLPFFKVGKDLKEKLNS